MLSLIVNHRYITDCLLLHSDFHSVLARKHEMQFVKRRKTREISSCLQMSQLFKSNKANCRRTSLAFDENSSRLISRCASLFTTWPSLLLEGRMLQSINNPQACGLQWTASKQGVIGTADRKPRRFALAFGCYFEVDSKTRNAGKSWSSCCWVQMCTAVFPCPPSSLAPLNSHAIHGSLVGKINVMRRKGI
jgi:hypothetical protein